MSLDRAGDGNRTRDIQLGKLTLYQLSYSRNVVLEALAMFWRSNMTENVGHSNPVTYPQLKAFTEQTRHTASMQLPVESSHRTQAT